MDLVSVSVRVRPPAPELFRGFGGFARSLFLSNPPFLVRNPGSSEEGFISHRPAFALRLRRGKPTPAVACPPAVGWLWRGRQTDTDILSERPFRPFDPSTSSRFSISSGLSALSDKPATPPQRRQVKKMAGKSSYRFAIKVVIGLESRQGWYKVISLM